jgi:DNA-binding response OmpR family regulator
MVAPMGVAAPLVLAEEENGGSSSPEPKPTRRLSAVDSAMSREASRRVLRVLVVEDDPAMRLLITYNLEAAGFRVVGATTGQEGLQLAASESPDVVLLDVMLPDLGGFEVAERLRHLPIVFMSARAAESDIERGRHAGAIDYVTKPFDPVALPARLREDLEELDRSGAERVWALRFGTKP